MVFVPSQYAERRVGELVMFTEFGSKARVEIVNKRFTTETGNEWVRFTIRFVRIDEGFTTIVAGQEVEIGENLSYSVWYQGKWRLWPTLLTGSTKNSTARVQ